MTPLIRNLANYAAYHRDHRNVITHMVGIPLIVFAVEVLASRPVVAIGGMVMTPAILLSALSALFYLRLDLRFGLVMTVLLALAAWAGLVIAEMGSGAYLSIGIGAFAVGWAIQFLGHYYEGRKPAFLDDIRGLIIGPLFVVAEIGFLMGARPEVRTAIDRAQLPASS